MIITRYVLMGLSGLGALFILLIFLFGGYASIFLLAALVFLIVNSFYVFFTRPTVTTSDIFKRVSGFFALASLEMQYQAEEARTREIMAEERQRAEAEQYQHKLQAAKDVLQHLALKLPLGRKDEASTPQITHQAQPKGDALALPLPAPIPEGNVRSGNGQEAMERSTVPRGPEGSTLMPPVPTDAPMGNRLSAAPSAGS